MGTVHPAQPYHHNIVTNCWEKELLDTSAVTDVSTEEEVSDSFLDLSVKGKLGYLVLILTTVLLHNLQFYQQFRNILANLSDWLLQYNSDWLLQCVNLIGCYSINLIGCYSIILIGCYSIILIGCYSV